MTRDAGPRWRASGALVPALFAGVALWRRDLFVQAWGVTAQTLARGGPGRWRLLGEIALFAGILAASWREIAARSRPAHQAAVVCVAAALGWAAEAWGTRLGLWTYYTGETPPLWIVPAWSLGALVIEHLAERARARWGRLPSAFYWTTAAAALAVIVGFSGPRLGRPAAWAVPIAAAAALAARSGEDDDFWILAAGFGAVFFADLWGTTNGCWEYYRHGLPGGLWQGIAFGMAFDAVVVLASLRLTRALRL
jgi:hypothetical protein